MRNLLQGLLFLLVLMLANVVGAGVFMVLGPIVKRLDEAAQVAATAIVGFIAVSCAIVFITGGVRMVVFAYSRWP